MRQFEVTFKGGAGYKVCLTVQAADVIDAIEKAEVRGYPHAGVVQLREKGECYDE